MSSTKKCPRCLNEFVCNPTNISDCQCSGITFSDKEKAFIEQQQFSDCLCISCLKALKEEAAQHTSNT